MNINFEKFEQLTLGDSEFARELLEIYIKQFESYIEEVNDFMTDLDLNKFRLINHNLRATAVTLDLNELLESQNKLKNLVSKEANNIEVSKAHHELIGIVQAVIEALKAAIV